MSTASVMELSPLEVSILHLLYAKNRDMDCDEITKETEPLFGEIKTTNLMQALVNVLEKEKRYVESRYVIMDNKQSLAIRYSLAPKAFTMYFEWKTRGRSAGTDIQVDTMKMIAFQQMRLGRYCILNFEGTGNGIPCMLIITPNAVNYGGKQVYSQSWWNEDSALAVVVETDPTKRLDDIYATWKQNHDCGLNVWFITFSENHRDVIRDALDSHGVPPISYAATVFPQQILTKNVDIIVELPYIAPHINQTDSDEKRRHKTALPPMSKAELAVWGACMPKRAAQSRK